MRRTEFDRALEIVEAGVDVLTQLIDAGGLLRIIGCKMVKARESRRNFSFGPIEALQIALFPRQQIAALGGFRLQ